MSLLHDPLYIAESRRFCRRLAKQSGSNFLWAFPSLDKSKRRAMYAIYAFMRFSDDIIDNPLVESHNLPDANAWQATASRVTATEQFAQWRSLLERGLLSNGETPDEMFGFPEGRHDDRCLDAIFILPSLLESIERFGIPSELFFTLLDGVEMDLTKNRYRNFDELEQYCERVASAVGLICIHIWGFKDRETPNGDSVFELARRVGIAYQLTNILRDLKEDAAMDRVYLPMDEIAAAGYSVEELKRGEANPAFERLMRSQLDRAEGYYLAGRELYARLKPEGKKIFGLMTATYHAILKRIAARPAAVFTDRIRPGRFERLRLVAQWTCFAPKELVL